MARRISDHAIHRVAHAHFQKTSLPQVILRQAFWELWIFLARGIQFRQNRNCRAREEYAKMSLNEFENINLRQNWANWRTIPKNLATCLESDQPVKAIDLCCGSGNSTEVLAYYLPAGSEILGLEYNPQFVEMARIRMYRNRSEGRCSVHFHTQSVLDPFSDEKGVQIQTASFDVVNASGAFGHHFAPREAAIVVGEIRRILKPDGFAMIDTGKKGTDKKSLIEIFSSLGFEQINAAKSCWIDRHEQLCFAASDSKTTRKDNNGVKEETETTGPKSSHLNPYSPIYRTKNGQMLRPSDHND